MKVNMISESLQWYLTVKRIHLLLIDKPSDQPFLLVPHYTYIVSLSIWHSSVPFVFDVGTYIHIQIMLHSVLLI